MTFESHTIRAFSEEITRVLASYSGERHTGKIVVEIDMRTGGIGAVNMQVTHKLLPEMPENQKKVRTGSNQ